MRRDYTQEDYLPAKGLAQWTVRLTYAAIVLNLLYYSVYVLAVLTGTQKSLVKRTYPMGATQYAPPGQGGIYPPVSVPQSSWSYTWFDLSTGAWPPLLAVAFGLSALFMTIAASLVFFAWSRRVIINCRAMQTDLRVEPFESWLSWCLPIVNFFWPYGVMYHMSVHAHPGYTDEATKKWIAKEVAVWWTITVVAGLIMSFDVTISYESSRVASYLGIWLLIGVVIALEFLSWWLCLRLVRRITDWQKRKAADRLGWY